VADRDQIIEFCDQVLETSDFDDYGPNGLQVPGSEQVERVITGVSAHRELIERAVAAGGQMLLVHHGLFWDFLPRALSEQMAERLRLALVARLSVAGYHLPLDAHREIGNNALLCELLGFELESGGWAEVKGHPIGTIGHDPEGVEPAELAARVARALGREPLLFANGSRRVRRIGIVSGAGASEIHAAVELGLDAFLTGEPAEHVMADAAEGGVHFLAAGHYATETVGIRRLGELVAERFAIEHTFIDVPNPV
jgi:dinuclear metal center YbgI/SA1388 family protein